MLKKEDMRVFLSEKISTKSIKSISRPAQKEKSLNKRIL